MSLLRGLALHISAAVVRYASPGCKEWAEGLAREVEFVQGDWAALGWALGSVRILFDYREAPVASLADLQAAAERFAQFTRKRATYWVLGVSCLGWIPRFFFQSYRATNWLERTGCGVAVLGYTSLAIVVMIQWRHWLRVPPSDDVQAVLQFHKAELGRNLRSGRISWIAISAATVLCVGLALAVPTGWAPYASGLLWVGAMLGFLQMRRIYRRRLERLEVLSAERS
jgi:hypothetical protein